MQKFENVDILRSLNAIMQTNTKHYKSDFKYDAETFKEAVKSQEPDNKNYIWFSRPSGTECLRERDVFLKDSAEYNRFCFYAEQTKDKILAYAVEIIGEKDGKLAGNIYELDYHKHYQHVKDSALPINYTNLVYERGMKPQDYKKPFDMHDSSYGKLLYYEQIPKDVPALYSLLHNEKNIRDKFKSGDIKEHIEKLSGKERKPSIREELKAAKSKSEAKKELKTTRKNHDFSL